MIFKQKLVGLVVILSVLSSACKKLPFRCAFVKSANNKVSCKVDYSKLARERLAGIAITDIGIPEKEKIRHLNELNSMPDEFLNVMRDRITVELTFGAITNLAQYAHLKGVRPRGWTGDATWDDVPGIGGASSLALGESIMNNNAWSLAIHEATHSVDVQSRFRTSKEFIAAFGADKGKPHPADSNGVYRTSYPEEYLAIAVDEYYCNDTTEANLKNQYPLAYDLIENHFLTILKNSGAQTPLPGAPLGKPDTTGGMTTAGIPVGGSNSPGTIPTPIEGSQPKPDSSTSIPAQTADNVPQAPMPYTVGKGSTKTDSCD